LKRIQAILGTPMSDDLREWARRRAHILEQFVEKDKTGSSSSESASEEL
jgi:hypothetical protein